MPGSICTAACAGCRVTAGSENPTRPDAASVLRRRAGGGRPCAVCASSRGPDGWCSPASASSPSAWRSPPRSPPGYSVQHLRAAAEVAVCSWLLRLWAYFARSVLGGWAAIAGLRCSRRRSKRSAWDCPRSVLAHARVTRWKRWRRPCPESARTAPRCRPDAVIVTVVGPRAMVNGGHGLRGRHQ